MPPAAESTKRPTASRTVTVSPTAAASAIRNAVSAVASLNSPSPTSTSTVRRGSPSRLAMEMAATVSGGPSTAPSTNATGSGIPGISQCIANPVSTVVTSTIATDRIRTADQFSRSEGTEVSTAAWYSSGGSRTISTNSGSRS